MDDGVAVVWCCSLSVDSSKSLKVVSKSMALWSCDCAGSAITLAWDGWRLVVSAVLGEFQWEMADEEVETKNACIGSCRRVNISRLGIGHVDPES